MKTAAVLTLLLLSTIEGWTQQAQCMQAEFSGEVRQGQKFSQDLGEGLTFSVDPMRLKDDARWGWFQMRVIKDDERGIFVFGMSDRNLLLATDFWSAFIGGFNSDLKAALGYRSRYFVFPVFLDDKQKVLEATSLVNAAKTPGEIRSAVAALQSIRLAQARFEITDYGLAEGEPPRSVEWVKFTVVVILPPDFAASGRLGTAAVECPAIPDEVIENIRSPKRHQYLQPTTTSTTVER